MTDVSFLVHVCVTLSCVKDISVKRIFAERGEGWVEEGGGEGCTQMPLISVHSLVLGFGVLQRVM